MRATCSIVVKPPGRLPFVRWIDADSEAAARGKIAALYGDAAIESICPLPAVRK